MSPDEVKDLVDFNPDEIDYVASPDTRMMTLKDRIAEMEEEKVQKAINNFYAALHDRPTIYSFDLDQKILPLFFDVASFRGGERTLRTEISFEVPTAELQFMQKAGVLAADLEFRVLVHDVDMKEIASVVDTVKPTMTGDWLSDKGPRPRASCPPRSFSRSSRATTGSASRRGTGPRSDGPRSGRTSSSRPTPPRRR